MRNMTAGELHCVYDKGECPNCSVTEFKDGPRGGLMKNVDCVGCGMKLNVSDAPQMRFGQVLSEPTGYAAPAAPAGQAPSSAAALPQGKMKLAFTVSSLALALTSLALTFLFIKAGIPTASTVLNAQILSAIAITAAASAALGLSARAMWTAEHQKQETKTSLSTEQTGALKS
jgi:hypothetical protein